MKTLKISMLVLLMNFNRSVAQQKPTMRQSQRITYITGKITDRLKTDTLSLVLTGPYFSYQTNPERFAAQIITTTVDQTGKFRFKIPTENSPFHVSLFLSSKRDEKFNSLIGNGNIADYLIEPGDSINIVFDKQKLYFSGNGSSLFEAQYKVEQADNGGKTLRLDEHSYFKKNINKWLSQKDSILDIQLNALEGYKARIPPTSYSIIRADVIGANRTYVYSMLSFTAPFFISGEPIDVDLDNLCKNLTNRPAYIDLENRAALSPKYVDYLYNKLKIEIKYQRAVNKIDVRLDLNYFDSINKEFKGVLRDKLLAWWLTDVSSVGQLKPEYIANALSVMHTPVFIQIVQQLKETYSKGNPVTDFGFKDVDGKTVHLADFKGKVLFVDLWFTGCTGCINVAKGLPNVEEAFKGRRDVLFLSISIDKDKKQWLKSIDKNPASHTYYTHYTTATTKYLYTAGTGDNNPFIKKYVPTGAFPQLLIVDKQGRIFSSTPHRPVNAELQKALVDDINDALANK